jgi:uncharacterized protein YndB with AHSA1/START domain
MDLGTYIQYDGQPAVRFERIYPHPPDRVWRAVSEPGELAHWFPSSVQIEARPGGTISFSGDPYTEDTLGRVLVFDPPHRLAFTWGPDQLHLALDPVGDGHCRLTLVNVLSDRSAAARNAAGWSVCLLELDKTVAGQPGDGPHSTTAAAWEPIYDAHVAAGLPSGAPIPAPS